MKTLFYKTIVLGSLLITAFFGLTACGGGGGGGGGSSPSTAAMTDSQAPEDENVSESSQKKKASVFHARDIGSDVYLDGVFFEAGNEVLE